MSLTRFSIATALLAAAPAYSQLIIDVKEKPKKPWKVSTSVTLAETPIDPADTEYRREITGGISASYIVGDLYEYLPNLAAVSVGVTYEDELTYEDNISNIQSLVVGMNSLIFDLDNDDLRLTVEPSVGYNLNEDLREFVGYQGFARLQTGLVFKLPQLIFKSVQAGPTVRYSKYFNSYDTNRLGGQNNDRLQRIGGSLSVGIWGDISTTASVTNDTVWLEDGSKDLNKYNASVSLAYAPALGFNAAVGWSQRDNTLKNDDVTNNIDFTYADTAQVSATVGYKF
ncbi:MAG: hypothetical protein HRU19_15315 [Pseudobacteriovorax sp.]|nr:hypothetical protein [Pseudobacteriovorax sp.]